MEPESSKQSDAALNDLLNEWRIDSALPPRFGEQVWQRIARSEAPPSNPFTLWRAWIAQVALRPAFAVSYATILLVIGLSAGYWQARVKSGRATEELGVRYVQMVDPYQVVQH